MINLVGKESNHEKANKQNKTNYIEIFDLKLNLFTINCLPNNQ